MDESVDEFADYQDNYFGFDAGNGIIKDDELLAIAHDIFTDEELAEILDEEDYLGVDISLDDLYDELDEADSEEDSDWAE